nr:hypothetical protein [Tanacetum cinerariifolium]
FLHHSSANSCSGISILLAVGTPSTGSGNLYCQWELSPSSGNALCILFPTISKHMIGNKSFLTEYQEIDDGFVTFGGSPKGDHLGKFDGKANEGFLVGYSINKKAFIVFSSRTRKVEETLHVNFLENKPNVAGSGPEWLFDIDSLTKSMNYELVFTGNQSNGDVDVNAGDQPGDVNAGDIQGVVNVISRNDDVCQGNEIRIDSSTHAVNAASRSINTASNIITGGSLNINTVDSNHTNMLTLEAANIYDGAFDDRDLGAEADTNNLDSSTVVSPIPTNRVHKDHPKEQIIRDPNLNTQTRRMINFFEETAIVSFINRQKRKNHKDFQNCLFACFLSQMEPKKDVWTLVDLPYRKRDIGSKWVSKNKLDERGIVIRKKATLVAQGHTQEEGIDYDEVFAPVAKLEAITLFLAYASFKDFIVYQMDVNSAFLYGKIEEEMSLMGELTFFLGMQVKKKQDGIFIRQDKYVAEILKKFRFSEVKTARTLMETSKPLLKDEDGQECKNQIVVANSTTEAEYVAALSYCG